MREVITSIEIRAKKEAVWSTIMDFPAYPEWNPFIKQIAGRVAVGHRLQVHMTLHKGHVPYFPPSSILSCRSASYRGVVICGYRASLMGSIDLCWNRRVTASPALFKVSASRVYWRRYGAGP